MKKIFQIISICFIIGFAFGGIVACDEKQEPIVNPIVEQGPYYIEDNSLPEISLSENDTKGKIFWDEEQEIKLGENEYTWTFAPANSITYKQITGKISLTFVNRNSDGDGEDENDPPTNLVINNITQSAVIIYETGSAISLVALNFNIPENTTFVSATCETDIINAGNYFVTVVVSANINYTINGSASYEFNNVSVTVIESSSNQYATSTIIDHNNAQKEDLLALSNSQINSIKNDLRIAYFHTSHGNQIIEGNYAINYMFGDEEGSMDFSDAIVFDSYGSNLYIDAGQKGSVANNLGPDIGSLVTATKSFFGDAGKSGDLLYKAGENLDVNVVIWSWCGELSVFSEERVQQYLDDLNELENYYNGINNPRKVVFVYMTGHLFNETYYNNPNSSEANNIRNNELIRDYCIANNKILFDFEDIECYNPDGEYFGNVCNDTSLYWDGAVAKWWARDWENKMQEHEYIKGEVEPGEGYWVNLNSVRNSEHSNSYSGFMSLSNYGFLGHVEYSTLLLSKAYAFWVLLSHLTTVV